MNKKRNIVSKVWHLLEQKQKWQTLLMLVLIIISAGAELIGVSIIMPIINLTMGQGNAEDSIYCRIIIRLFHFETEQDVIIGLLVVTILIYVFKNVYLAWMYRCLYGYAMNIRRKFAMRLLNAYLSRPYPFFVKRKTSDLMRSVNDDTVNLYGVILGLCLTISQAVTAGCIVAYLAATNILMTLMVVGCLGICAVGIIKGLQKSTGKMGKANQSYVSSLLKGLQQSFEGIKEIKVLNTEAHFSEIYDGVYKKYADNERKFRIANMIPKYLIETVVIAGIMGYLALNICLNPNYAEIVPQLAVFVAAAYKLLPSVNNMYSNINSIHFYKASVDLIYNDLQEIEHFSVIEEIEGDSVDFRHEISMEKVDFQYEDSDRKVLQNISLKIKKGESIALVGPSGGGKTTMADLLLGLQTPTAGKILVDGVDISKHMKAWHEKIGYIPQSIFLIEGSIRDNVAFGISKEEIDDKKVWHVLEEAQLSAFVKELEHGLDTEVGERGVKMSGGQRQRIGIARALYRNPEILVFDEATSALDNETEKEVMKAINGLHGNKTMIMIAHRLSTIENCDKVYKVENAQVERER